MLKPANEFSFSLEWFTVRIKLAAGETEQDRYKAWIGEIRRAPHYCQRHAQTRLALGRRHCSITPACKGKEMRRLATCGPLDIDDPSPAITVMMPDED